MAKNTIYVDVVVDDKGTTKKVALATKDLEQSLNSTDKAATKAYRSQQGLSQSTSNSTKAFAKSARGINGFLQIYATWAANVFAVSAAFEFLKRASDVTNLIAGQEALGAITGVAYKTITNSVRAATDGQLAYADAASSVAIGTAAGLSTSQLEKLAKGAKNVSVVLGRDLTDSFNRLIRGTTKAEPELLDELGIILRIDDATKKYADSLGVAKDSLSTFQRSQAVTNEVVSQLDQKFSKVEELMDPSAASLNRFLVSFDDLLNKIKSGAIKALGPVFDSLSGNVTALASALSLVGFYIIKGLLPNFNDWAASAAKSMDMQKGKVEQYRIELQKTKADALALANTQAKALKQTTQQATNVLTAGGIDASKEKAGSGLAFMSGSSDTARARANALKIIENAEKQLVNNSVVTTGKLKGLNAQQVTDLKIATQAKIGILTQFETKTVTINQRIGASFKIMAATVKTSIAGMQLAMTRFVGFVGKWGSRILGALGWAGVLYTVGSVIKDVFFSSTDTISIEVEKANQKTENFSSTLSTLNEELEGVARVKKEGMWSTLAEEIIAIGNAFTSADITNKIAQFNELDPNSPAYAEARKELQTTLSVLAKLNPAIKKYANAFSQLRKGEKLKDIEGLSLIEETARSAGVAVGAIPEGMKKIDEELRNLTGTGKGLDPTADLRSNLSTTIEQVDVLIGSLKDKLSDPEIQKKQEQVALATRRVAAAEEYLANAPMFAEAIAERVALLETQKAALAEVTAEYKKLGVEQKQAELTAAEKRGESLRILNEEMTAVSGDLIANQNTILSNTRRIADETTLGITYEQKRINLGVEAIEQANQLLQAEQRLISARARKNAADRGTDSDAKKAAEEAYDSAEAEVYALRQQNKLAEQRRQIDADKLALEESLLGNKQQQFDQSVKIAGIEQEIKNIQSGATIFSGDAAEKKIEELTDMLLAAKVLMADLAVQETTAKLAQAISLRDAGKGSEDAVMAARKEQQGAIEAAAGARGDQRSNLNFAQRTIQDAINGTNKLEEKLQTLSIDPVEQKFKETLFELGTKANELNSSQKEELYAQIKAQEELNRAYEARTEIIQSVESNMTSALTSIMDGTKSVKQAFADMALSILQDIAAMIAKMLIFKALQAATGGFGGFFGFANGGVAEGGFTYANGGMAEGGFRAFASGGMVNKPTLGLVGEGKYNEAIVPLPDGKSIPVIMKENSQQNMNTNNVVVNVAMDGSGNGKTQTGSSNSSQAEGLGRAIAVAVQKEIQNQKRAGGMLSPFGAA